jgi:hypothetical protein
VFIAELQSWPGNSGSPVFLQGGGQTRLAPRRNHSKFLGMIVASFVNRFSMTRLERCVAIRVAPVRVCGRDRAGYVDSQTDTLISPKDILSNADPILYG